MFTRKSTSPGTDRLALRNIDDHLCFTGDDVWAWYVLPTQLWAFRSDTQREQLLHGFGDALAWQLGVQQGQHLPH